jgi:hypothetical protein
MIGCSELAASLPVSHHRQRTRTIKRRSICKVGIQTSLDQELEQSGVSSWIPAIDQELDGDGPAFDGIVSDIAKQLGQFGGQPVPDQLPVVAGPFLCTSDKTTDEFPHGSGLVSVIHLCRIHLGEISIDDGFDQIKDHWTKELRRCNDCVNVSSRWVRSSILLRPVVGHLPSAES